MEANSEQPPHLVDATKRLAHQAMVMCENRIELLLLEAEEERDHIFRAFWLSVGVAVFLMLTGTSLTVLIVVACWPWSPLGVLAILTALYGGITAFLLSRLARLRREWQSFSATLNELRKDRECLEKNLN